MDVIGLMSGTSVDGIDGVLVSITGQGYAIDIELLEQVSIAYSPELRRQILEACGGASFSPAALAALDDDIAISFANAAQQLGPAELIASHGQTIFHRPPNTAGYGLGYSQQLGRGALIAHITQTATVSDFRSADIAASGQGAPLVSPVDACLLSHPTRHRCVQNLGGIGNLTYLPPWRQGQSHLSNQIVGWDTGPGNALIDWAVSWFTDGERTYDHNGEWAAQGTPHQGLIEQWLTHPFFHAPPPKSTGRELFGADYGQHCWHQGQDQGLSEADFLATLTAFTAATVAHSYRQLPQMPEDVLLCGGGSQNQYLRSQLQLRLGDIRLTTTDEVGLSSRFKEAIAFAILGYWRWTGQPGNLPTVTGARHPCLLGHIDQPSRASSSSRPKAA